MKKAKSKWTPCAVCGWSFNWPPHIKIGKANFCKDECKDAWVSDFMKKIKGISKALRAETKARKVA